MEETLRNIPVMRRAGEDFKHVLHLVDIPHLDIVVNHALDPLSNERINTRIVRW